MLPKGTLVQVRESALHNDLHGGPNMELVHDSGWLWVVVEGDGRGVYDCKSLATGRMGVWLDREITVAKKEQDDAVQEER